MHVLVISGSRNPEGQTARALNALLLGVKDAGGTGETIFLPAIDIRLCRQCDKNGWGSCISEHKCVIEDDFAAMVGKLKAADAAVFATPVYFGDLSESLRAFLDRLRRCMLNVSGPGGVAGKSALGICVAGGGGGGAPSCVSRLQGILETCGFDVVDLMPVRRQNLEMKCRVLRETGKWLVQRPGTK